MKRYDTLWKTNNDELFREQLLLNEIPNIGFKFTWHYIKWIVVDVEVNFDKSTAEIILEKREA